MIFETISTSAHEQVVFCQNKDAGLKAIIAQGPRRRRRRLPGDGEVAG